MLVLYSIVSVLGKYGWDKCPKNGSLSLSHPGKRNSWKSAARREGLPMAEIIRRAIDAYLAWDDKTYEECATALHPPSRPHSPLQKEEPFIPISEERGFLA